MKLKYIGPKNPCKVSLGNQTLTIEQGETAEVGGALGKRLADVEGNGFNVVGKAVSEPIVDKPKAKPKAKEVKE